MIHTMYEAEHRRKKQGQAQFLMLNEEIAVVLTLHRLKWPRY
jgi:hypothetical protein